jgi:hypothetical protein
MPDDPIAYRRQEIGLIWLVAYLATMALIVWLVFHVRTQAMLHLDTPEARAEWEHWRQAAAEQAAEGPVKRHVPSTHEPPSLILLRDYFGVMLGSAIVFGSLLFAILMIAVRGVFRRPLPRTRL